MAGQNNNSQRLPLEELLSLRARLVRRPLVVMLSDTPNETLKASGSSLITQLRKTNVEDKQKVRDSQRSNYRIRKRAERELAGQLGLINPFLYPIDLLPNEIIDAAIRQEQRNALLNSSLPLILATNPIWNYPDEARRMLGYYTQGEREYATRLNDLRSSSFLSGIMPNFGRLAAYNNPGAEMDAFRQTALYMPNAVVAGSSFGLPSATLATIAGAKAGWQTAGNLAQRTFSAGTQAVKSAAPVVTNPRWAATTAAFTVPAVAQASDGGDYTGLGYGIGIPLAIGAGAYFTKGKWWGKKNPTTPTTTPLSGRATYKPDRRLFTWEYPLTWETRQKKAIRLESRNKAILEWNSIAGDPVKEKEFISKYNIRKSYGTPLWLDTKKKKPKMGDDGKQVIVYDFIDREDVPMFLEDRLYNVTSNLPDVSRMVFTEPTESQQFWMKARNLGRIGTWVGIPAGLVGGYMVATSSGDSRENTPSDSTLTATPDSVRITRTATPDSVRAREVVGVTLDGRILITPRDSSSVPDTIIPRTYTRLQFND